MKTDVATRDDAEDYDTWNDSAIYSLPIVREPTSRDTAAVLQVRYGSYGPGAETQACVVVTGRSILTMARNKSDHTRPC